MGKLKYATHVLFAPFAIIYRHSLLSAFLGVKMNFFFYIKIPEWLSFCRTWRAHSVGSWTMQLAPSAGDGRKHRENIYSVRHAMTNKVIKGWVKHHLVVLKGHAFIYNH